MTETTSPTLPFAPGAPIEHRGIVVQPLFPVADPVAEYLTLGEALRARPEDQRGERLRQRAATRRRQPARRARAAATTARS